MSLSPTYVPADGPTSADIMIVGEAPGRDEEREGRPFVGRSGELLNRYLERAGIRREECYVTNLCHYKPRKNSFKHAVGTKELEAGLSELATAIHEVQPNVVIALGGWPLYHLTGKSGKSAGTGISTYRGSILPAIDRFGGVKVIPTYHPSYILRVWNQNPIFYADLEKASRDSTFPELRYPEYESHINPPLDELKLIVDRMIDEGEYVSMDIETFPNGTYSCIGWCNSDQAGYTVTFERPDLAAQVKRLWESDVPKIFQYGTYDISFMRYWYDWKVGGVYDGLGWDTYIAAANLMPDFKRSLDFLCSIYTRFPYYKDERKVWKEESDMTILWEYNIKDVIATWQIAMTQMEEMDGHYSAT